MMHLKDPVQVEEGPTEESTADAQVAEPLALQPNTLNSRTETAGAGDQVEAEGWDMLPAEERKGWVVCSWPPSKARSITICFGGACVPYTVNLTRCKCLG